MEDDHLLWSRAPNTYHHIKCEQYVYIIGNGITTRHYAIKKVHVQAVTRVKLQSVSKTSEMNFIHLFQ